MSQCSYCRNTIPDTATFCGHCGTQQDANTGWYKDPSGRWDARYFASGGMTGQVLIAGSPYAESPVTAATIDRSRIEEVLLKGERLLHEVHAGWKGTTKPGYYEDPGIIAVTSYRALKYQTGKGSRSTVKGEGPLSIHWTLALNPQYLDLLQESAAAGDRAASQWLNAGVQIISGYQPGPIEKDRPRSGFGSCRATLYQKTVGGGGWGPFRRDHASLGERYLREFEHAFSFGASAARSGQHKVRSKELVLELWGWLPNLLRVDQLLAEAAQSMTSQMDRKFVL